MKLLFYSKSPMADRRPDGSSYFKAHAALGVDLMRKAFNPDKGPLARQTDAPAEREGLMHLFSGAILSYKNPHSHRFIQLSDPSEAWEQVMLATHLLRIVDARR